MTLRMRVLPRFPAKISATNGLTVERPAGTPNVVVKPSFGDLVQIPNVGDGDNVFFMAWDKVLGLYRIMSFNDLFAGVSDLGFMTSPVYDPQGKHADAFARANHTGTQAISTIVNLQSSLDGKADAAATASALALKLNATSGTLVTPLGEFLRGYLSGLSLSNNVTDAANDIDIATGSAGSDGSTPALMTLAAVTTKRIDASWSLGSGNGGLDTGVVADGKYYAWEISRSDTGVVDGLLSLSASAPTMPASYDRKRILGSFQRVGGINQAPRSYTQKEATDWVAYTPTITGFGTPTTVAFYSRRVGDTIEVKGSFVSGTSTAVEARVSLGFNGTNGNIVSEGSAKIPVQAIAGVVAQNAVSASSFVVLAERSVGYFTFGIQSSGAGATTKQNGSSIAASGALITLFASVPVAGW